MAKRYRSSKKKLPQDPIELSIQRLSHDGRGVGSIAGKVAFVDGALPGETVRARYVNERSQFAEMSLETVIQASPQRVNPVCAVYGRCGGCVLQHLDPAAQIDFKRDHLLEKLRHNGIDTDTLPLLENLTADDHHYRRKARLAVRYVSKRGGVLVGFREKHGSFITDMHDCPVLVAPLGRLIEPLRELLSTLDGRQLIPQVEVAAGEIESSDRHPEGLQVALVLRHLEALSPADLEKILSFARHHHCDMYLQPGGTATIHKIWPVDTLPRLHYRLPDHGLELAFHPVDFTQVNGGINRKLVALALRLLAPQPQHRILDLFCGLGNFTLPLARHCAAVVGVEGSEDMVARGRENAAANGIDNVEFHAADLSADCHQHGWMQQTFDRVLLDPPRSGALEIIEQLSVLGADRLVYISCNPSTLARDAARLQELGYALVTAGVMDMFPHTAHVESIAVFERVC
ncbi:MAG: hypothetical protein RLZZ385_1355 [Pseudomonadota bacterium]|jgi:23S rRNA (uracil1939-C5)-methyltransferase